MKGKGHKNQIEVSSILFYIFYDIYNDKTLNEVICRCINMWKLENGQANIQIKEMQMSFIAKSLWIILFYSLNINSSFVLFEINQTKDTILKYILIDGISLTFRTEIGDGRYDGNIMGFSNGS